MTVNRRRRPAAPVTTARSAAQAPAAIDAAAIDAAAKAAAFSPRLTRLALETRILFDGAAAVAGADAVAEDFFENAAPQSQEQEGEQQESPLFEGGNLIVIEDEDVESGIELEGPQEDEPDHSAHGMAAGETPLSGAAGGGEAPAGGSHGDEGDESETWEDYPAPQSAEAGVEAGVESATLDEPEADSGQGGTVDTDQEADAEQGEDGLQTPMSITGLDDDTTMPSDMEIMGDAEPEPVVKLPDEHLDVMLGEEFTFTLDFDNDGGTGYGPYVELYLQPGLDAANGEGVDSDDQDDGIRIDGITYLGQEVNYTIKTVGDTDDDDHPYARDAEGNPLKIGTDDPDLAGWKVVIIELPFGSYTPDQPAASLVVAATMHRFADLSKPLEIKARAGFRYGSTAVEDYATDPSDVGEFASFTVTPQLVRHTHDFDHDEGETVTGPNFKRTMTTTIDVADGQELTDYTLRVSVPDNIVVEDVLVNDSPVAYTRDPATGDIVVNLGDISGTDNTVSVVYHVPEREGGEGEEGDFVLDPETGLPETVSFNVSGEGQWKPLDPRDGPGTTPVEYDPDGPEFDHKIKSIAVQKGVQVVDAVSGDKTDPKPGARADYTLNFQVSDYFQFGEIVITDTLADGHDLLDPEGEMDPVKLNAFMDTLKFTFHYQGAPYSAALLSRHVVYEVDGDDNIKWTFNISAALMDAAGSNAEWPDDLKNGILTGGKYNNADFGRTEGRITYSAFIADKFVSPPGSGDPSVNHGDVLHGGAGIGGRIDGDGEWVGDGTDAYIDIQEGGLDLLVADVFRDGVSTGDKNSVSPGDVVVYELNYDLRTGDFENLKFDVYLPKPVFELEGLAGTKMDREVAMAALNSGEWQLQLLDADGNVINDAFDSNGEGFGLTFDTANNKLTFNLLSREDTANLPATIQIRFAAKVGDEPFADGLFLTTQAQASDHNTEGVKAELQDIDQIRLNQPVLSVTHGVVKVGAEGMSNHWTGTKVTDIEAVNVDVESFDAGDHVRFGLAVANTGGHAAFNVTTTEIELPEGFAWADSTGNKLSAGGLADANLKVYLNGVELAGTQYTVSNGVITLASDVGIAAGRSGDTQGPGGSNILFITYDAVALHDITVGNDFESEAGVESFTNTAASTKDFLPGDKSLTDDATLATGTPQVKMVFKDGAITNDDTSAGHTTGNEVVIGEHVYYDIVVTLPEGVTEGLTLTPDIPDGMMLDTEFNDTGYQLITQKDTGDHSHSNALAGNFAGTSPNMTVAEDGKSISFDPITVDDNNEGTDNSFVVRVRMVTANVEGNQGGPGETGTILTPDVTARYNEGGSAKSIDIDTPLTQVVVVEPELTLEKTATPTTVDAGDTVTYEIVIDNASGVDAFDLTYRDEYDGALALGNLLKSDHAKYDASHGGSWTVTDAAGDDIDPSKFEWNFDDGTGKYVLTLKEGANLDLTKGEKITITVKAKTTGTVAAQSAFDSTAKVTWSSIDSDADNHGTYGHALERDGTGGFNDYSAADDAPVNVVSHNVLSRVGGLADTASPTDTTDEGAEHAVGEIVRFRMVVQVPEGTIPDMSVQLTLDDGYEYAGGATIALVADTSMTASNLNGVEYAPVKGSEGLHGNIESTLNPSNYADDHDNRPGGSITVEPGLVDGKRVFSLGTVVNADNDQDDSDGNFAAEYIVIEFNAIVKNIEDNQAATELKTSFEVYSGEDRLGDPSNTLTDIIVEPELSPVTKTISRSPIELANPDNPADTELQGEKVTLEVTNSFTATAGTGASAYEVVLTDSLQHGSDYSFVSITINETTYTSANIAASGYTIDILGADGGIRVNFGNNPLEPGQTVVLKYSVEVPATAMSPGTTTPAHVTWSSLPDGGDSHFPGFAGTLVGEDGGSTGERIWAEGDDNPNDYRVEGQAGYGMISGTLWDDTQRQDQKIDGGTDAPAPEDVEPRLGGIIVKLHRVGDGALVAVTKTATDGTYTFGGLPVGDYRVEAPASFEREIDTQDEEDAMSAYAGTHSRVVNVEKPEHIKVDIGYLRENDPPALTVGGGSTVTLTATEDPDQPDTPSHIPPTRLLPGDIAVSDPDLGENPSDGTVFGAGTITITLNGHIPNDKLTIEGLEVEGPEGLAGIDRSPGKEPVYDADAGTLTIYFTEEAKIGDIKAVLENLRYSHEGDDPHNRKARETNPDAALRETIGFTVELDDGKNKTGSQTDSGTGVSGKDTVNGTITLSVNDDPPVANADENNLTNRETTVSGQLIDGGYTTGSGTVVASGGDADTDPDTPIDELKVIRVELKTGGADPASEDVGASGETLIKGQYGTLTLRPDGGYTYVLNPDNRDVYELIAGERLEEVFEYTLTDRDNPSPGDLATARLTITINGTDAATSISPVDAEGNAAGAHEVEEKGLRPEADGGGTGHTATGHIKVEASSGIESVTIGDGRDASTLTPAQLAAATPDTPISIETAYGTLEIIGFTPTQAGDSGGAPRAGTVDYRYTLTKPVENDTPAESRHSDLIGLIVTPVTGDVGMGALTITIIDDGPEARADDNALDSWVDDPTVDGNVYDNDTIGADGPWSPVPEAPAPLTGVAKGTPGDAPTTGIGTPVPGQHGTLILDADGGYSYTLNPDADIPPGGTTDVFTYTITDKDGDTATATLTITIAGNHDPVAVNDVRSTPEDTPVSGNVIGNGQPGDAPDGDTDNDPLTVTQFEVAGSGPITVPSEPGEVATHTIPDVGTLEMGSDGSYTFTPVPDWNGDVPHIIYTVSDGKGGTATADLIITVDPVPDAVDDSTSTLVDVPVVIDPLGNDPFNTKDFPDDYDPPVVSVSDPPNGTITVDPDTGEITYTPDPGFIGEDTFTYTVTTTGGITETATVTITVTNNPPEALPDTRTVTQNTPAKGNVLTNDSEPDGHELTVTQFTFEVKTPATDGDGNPITDTDGNPVFNTTPYTVTVPDDGTPASETIPGVGIIEIDKDGNYTFTPESGWVGTVPPITYTVTDPYGATTTSTLEIRVTPPSGGGGGTPPPVKPPVTPEPPVGPEEPVEPEEPLEPETPPVPEPPAEPVEPPYTPENPDPEEDIRFQHPPTVVPGSPGYAGYIGSIGGTMANPTRPVSAMTPAGMFQQTIADTRSPVKGDQVRDVSVFFDGSVYNKIPRLPLPFHPIVYVNNEVRSAQAEREGADMRGYSNPFWFQAGEVLSNSIGTRLNQDPNLFVTHTIRSTQQLGALIDGVVLGRLGRIGLGADGALPTPDLVAPLPGNPPAATSPLESQSQQEPGGSEPQDMGAPPAAAEVLTDDDTVEDIDDAAVQVSRAAPSFSEQLRGGSSRLPVTLHAPKDAV